LNSKVNLHSVTKSLIKYSKSAFSTVPAPLLSKLIKRVSYASSISSLGLSPAAAITSWASFIQFSLSTEPVASGS
jgi:hypothetical protein